MVADIFGEDIEKIEARLDEFNEHDALTLLKVSEPSLETINDQKLNSLYSKLRI